MATGSSKASRIVGGGPSSSASRVVVAGAQDSTGRQSIALRDVFGPSSIRFGVTVFASADVLVDVWLVEFPTPVGQRHVEVLGSIFKVQPGEPVFVTIGLSTDESDVATPFPAGQVRELLLGVSEDAGAGRYKATLMNEGQETLLVVELTGSVRKGLAKGVQVHFADGEEISVKCEVLDGAPAARFKLMLDWIAET